MKLLRTIPFFLLLIPVFFCLHGSVENFGSVNFREVFLIGLSVMGMILLFCFISRIFTRHRLFAALIVFFISVWYFFFGAFHDGIKSTPLLHFLRSYTILLPALMLLTVLWIIFLKRYPRLWPKLTIYFNALFIIYCITDVVKLTMLIAAPPKKSQPISFNYSAVTNRPNVYFLLFDGYPGDKSLKDRFNFSNDRFNGFLRANNFVRLPVRSNYDITHYSISSVFNMRYIDDEYKVRKAVPKDLQTRQTEIQHAELFPIFRKMGYRILNYSIFDVEDSPGLSDENSFLLGHSILLTDKILLNRMKKDLTFLITDKVVKYLPFLKNQSVFIHRNNNIKAENLINETLKKQDTVPVFCYAHFLMPHAPYYYDSSGRANPNFNNPKENSPEFISYLKYTNKVAERILLSVKAKDPSAIIIFISDHGFRYNIPLTRSDLDNFDNFCAVHFAGGEDVKIPESISNVNIFPYLFNTCFNQNFSMLKDSSIHQSTSDSE